MIQAKKSQNLLQKSGTLQTVKQQKVNTRKAILKFETEIIKSSLIMIILIHLFYLQEMLQ